jgi:hypothetical protein
MCPNPVDIYIDGDTYQSDFNGSYLDIYRNKKIEVIRIDGQIVSKDQQYEYYVLLGTTGGVSEGTLTYLYDSGVHCDLADTELYGHRITKFTPITEITDPEEIINFTYMSEFHNQITSHNRITWRGDLITDGYCIVTNTYQGVQSVAVGTGIRNNTYRVGIVIVAPNDSL